MDSLDPFGEKNALRELGLAKGASQEEIRTKYRELSKVIKNYFQNQFAGCFLLLPPENDYASASLNLKID